MNRSDLKALGISLRRMRKEDVAQADELRQAAGWNQTIGGWTDLLSLNPDGCFVADLDGRIVGTVTTTRFSQELAWVGMMLVDPAHRKKGIGTGLMEMAVEHLRSSKVRRIGLDATPAGRPVYEKLGFMTVCELTRWGRNPVKRQEAEPSPGLRCFRESDLPSAIDIDAQARGIDRTELVKLLLRPSSHAAVVEREGKVVAWGITKPGARATYLGPVQGEAQACEAIFRSLNELAADQEVYCDIPNERATAIDLMQEQGFEKLRPLTRMFLGKIDGSGVSPLEFCITDPSTS